MQEIRNLKRNLNGLKMRKTLLILIFALIGITAMNSVQAQIIASGECGANGNNLTWTLTSDYKLTIKGSGAMKDWLWNYTVPWYGYQKDIKTLAIGDSVTTIGDEAFRYFHGLTSVTIPNSVTKIGCSAFGACINLQSLIIGNSVTTIGGGAFGLCYALKAVTIPNSVITIEASAFNKCTELATLIIGNSVTLIKERAFFECTSLKSVVIPNSVTEIERYVFYGCTSLLSITIPSSVTIISYDVFYETPWYNNKPNGIIYINNVLYKYKGEMPSGTTINIQEGTVSISPEAFSSCSNLSSVTIPNSVTTIGDNAFWNCTSLTSIISHAINPPKIYSQTFFQVPKNIPVSVPCISESTYKQTIGWKDFSNYINCICVGVNDITQSPNINLYPNPAARELYVKRTTQEAVDYSIFNLTGQIILTGKLQNNSTINVESLSNGMYYLKIAGKTVKFVKN